MPREMDKLPGPDLVRAAAEFAKLRLWESLEDDDAVAFVLPDRPDPIFGTVMGQSGQEFGITLVFGPYSRWQLHQMHYSPGEDDDVIDRLSFAGMTLTPRTRLPPALSKALKASPKTLPRGAKFPFVLIKDAGKHVRMPTPGEEEAFVYCLNALAKVADAEAFEPGPLDAEKILTLTLAGPAADPQVTIDAKAYAMAAPQETLPTIPAPEAARTAARIRASWIVGFPVLPAQIGDDDREVHLLVVVDAASGIILFANMKFYDELVETANTLFGLFIGTSARQGIGLPSEIIFADQRLFLAMQPALNEIQLGCRFDARHPAWLDVRDHLRKFGA